MRGGLPNEYAMSTGGRGGVKKGRKRAYILFECPLIGIPAEIACRPNLNVIYSVGAI